MWVASLFRSYCSFVCLLQSQCRWTISGPIRLENNKVNHSPQRNLFQLILFVSSVTIHLLWQEPNHNTSDCRSFRLDRVPATYLVRGLLNLCLLQNQCRWTIGGPIRLENDKVNHSAQRNLFQLILFVSSVTIHLLWQEPNHNTSDCRSFRLDRVPATYLVRGLLNLCLLQSQCRWTIGGPIRLENDKVNHSAQRNLFQLILFVSSVTIHLLWQEPNHNTSDCRSFRLDRVPATYLVRGLLNLYVVWPFSRQT